MLQPLRSSAQRRSVPASKPTRTLRPSIINPVVFSHDASLENCQVLCVECHTRKTGEEDIPAVAKSNRVLKREAGLTRVGNIRTWRSR